jgi:membrane dipeptidase
VACLGWVGGQTRAVTEAEVVKAHRQALLIDTHNDITSRTVEGYDIGKGEARTHTDIARLRAGGVGAVFFAAYVSGTYVKDNRAANRALQMIDTIRHDIVARYPNEFVLAVSADEIEAAHRKGKIAALIGVEGGHAIEDS